MDRRKFLKAAGVTAALAPSLSWACTPPPPYTTPIGDPNANDYRKYLQAKDIHQTTISSRNKLKREEILDTLLQRIPTRERVVQIHDTVMSHIIAEENNDIEGTMKTMVKNPVFEDAAAGLVIHGHKNVIADYTARFDSFPFLKRHVTNFMVDAKGVWVELVWEGYQKGPVRGIKPPAMPGKFVLPLAAYFEVDDDGLISRETAYYDQYLGLLGLDVLPDVLQNKKILLMLNPGLLGRLAGPG